MILIILILYVVLLYIKFIRIEYENKDLVEEVNIKVDDSVIEKEDNNYKYLYVIPVIVLLGLIIIVIKKINS